MREVRKFYPILFCIPLILFAISFVNDNSGANADVENNLSTDPSDIFGSNFEVKESRFIEIAAPTSKSNFLNSALASDAYVLTVNSTTARLKTGDVVSVSSATTNEHLTDFTISIKGDVNGDGEINLNDVVKVYQYYKNRISLSRAAQIAGDVTNTGEISLGDVAKIYQYSKGKIGGLS